MRRRSEMSISGLSRRRYKQPVEGSEPRCPEHEAPAALMILIWGEERHKLRDTDKRFFFCFDEGNLEKVDEKVSGEGGEDVK